MQEPEVNCSAKNVQQRSLYFSLDLPHTERTCSALLPELQTGDAKRKHNSLGVFSIVEIDITRIN
jgi:hypothetical protein